MRVLLLQYHADTSRIILVGSTPLRQWENLHIGLWHLKTVRYLTCCYLKRISCSCSVNDGLHTACFWEHLCNQNPVLEKWQDTDQVTRPEKKFQATHWGQDKALIHRLQSKHEFYWQKSWRLCSLDTSRGWSSCNCLWESRFWIWEPDTGILGSKDPLQVTHKWQWFPLKSTKPPASLWESCPKAINSL